METVQAADSTSQHDPDSSECIQSTWTGDTAAAGHSSTSSQPEMDARSEFSGGSGSPRVTMSKNKSAQGTLHVLLKVTSEIRTLLRFMSV